MKKIILNSILLAPLVVTSAITISSCSQSKDNIKHVDSIDEPIEQSKDDVAEPLTIKYAEVTFVKKEIQDNIKFVGSTLFRVKVGKTFASIMQPLAYDSKGNLSPYWVDAKGIKIKNTTKITGNMTVYPYFDSDVQLGKCVGISAIQKSKISLINHGDNNPDVKYSTDGFQWIEYTPGLSIEIEPGSAVYFKGRNTDNGFSHSEADYTNFSISGAVNINGNIATLLDDGEGNLVDVTHDYCFFHLFEKCSGIVSISSEFFPKGKLAKYCYAYLFQECSCLTDFPSSLLPNIELTGDGWDGTLCYAGMFKDCTGLTEIPTNLLPATTLSTYCYYAMFAGCTGIKELSPGILPATALKYGCYSTMFFGCTGLTKINAPEQAGDKGLLPAGTGTIDESNHLAHACYNNMFANCNKLSNVPIDLLPCKDFSYEDEKEPDPDAKTCAECYSLMFYGCTSLTNVPDLPATKLSKRCYESMFYNCSSLRVVKSDLLPAGNETIDPEYNLAESCYNSMFCNCTILGTNLVAGEQAIPNLPAQNLAKSCYANMFYGCSGLTDLSDYELVATTASDYCYDSMFSHCSALTNAPQIDLTTLANYCCTSMFSNCVKLIASPELIATQAKWGCYRAMFSTCSVLQNVGTIHIARDSWASYACAYMFDSCVALGVTNTGTGTPIITLPLSSDYDNDTTICENMFQMTAHYLDMGWSPISGSTYYQDWYVG